MEFGLSTNTPKVVISDRPPVQVALRDEYEDHAVAALLQDIRRGRHVVMIITRDADTSAIEVSARSGEWGGTVQGALDVFREASAKVVGSLLRRPFNVRGRQ